MVGFVVVKTPSELKAAIFNITNSIRSAVDKSVAPSAKEIAELIKGINISLYNERIGSKNVTHRPNKRAHNKIANSLMIVPRRTGTTLSHYDVYNGVPHVFWVNLGSKTITGLPWSHPKGKKPRDYSKSKFTGYNVASDSIKEVIKSDAYIKIVRNNIITNLSKLKL